MIPGAQPIIGLVVCITSPHNEVNVYNKNVTCAAYICVSCSGTLAFVVSIFCLVRIHLLKSSLKPYLSALRYVFHPVVLLAY